MLTIKQPPPSYGYKSVHDLPTPPSTSRPSPPLNYQEPIYKSAPAVSHNRSPIAQPMSAPHRGLPPPAAMTLPPQPPSSGPPPSHPPHPHHGQPPPLPQPPHQGQPWTSPALPPPPQQWQGAEESMRTWLQAKTEEERTKQEEEKTRQESLRLEQRKIEMDMLRASLGGGIPPPMIPLVFAGMGSGGILPQAALEWAQQFISPSQQGPHPQLLPPQRPHSPEHQRDPGGPGHVQYSGVAAQPAPAHGHVPYGPYPGSPTRPRGQTVSGVMGRPMGAAANITSMAPSQPGQGAAATMTPYQAHAHTHTQAQPIQHDTSPSIYFHHWQPPTSQSGSGSNRPGTPTGDAQRKRKAGTGPGQQSIGMPSDDRFRSPPPFSQTGSSNPSPSRKGHKRLRSDVSWYRTPGHMYGEDTDRPPRARTPPSWAPPRDRDMTKSGKQSVSSLLSGEPGDGGLASRQVLQGPRLEPPLQRTGGLAEKQAGDGGGDHQGTPAEAESRARPGGSGQGEGET